MDALLASARVVALPLRVRFRGVLEREAMLFEGPNGWTEWSPFVEYEDEEAAQWLAASIDYGWGQIPEPIRAHVGVNATLPAVAADQVGTVLGRFGRFDTVKVKVAEAGQSVADDIERVLATKTFAPEAAIRLDANGGFEVEAAIELAEALHRQGIQLEYFEQPVKTIAELAEARIRLNRIGVRVAADESVRKVSDPLAVAQAGAADLLILKAQPLGGITRAIDIAREAGLPWVVSSALETSIGMSMGVHLAALNPIEADAGLGTLSLFAGDVCERPLVPQDARLAVGRVTPSESRLEIFKAEDHRTDWWIERLERCYKLI
jgi:o-succinylbenzoate synthase